MENKFIGTHYGVSFPNITTIDKIQESKDFITTAKNTELQAQYLTLSNDIFTQYSYNLEHHLKNSTLLSYWLGYIYQIAERFTTLVENIEKDSSCFDDDLLNIRWSKDYLNGINDVITLNTNNLNMNLHDLLNYFSSKLYMISINILKDMQDVLVKQVNQNITNDEYNQIKLNINEKLTESFYEIKKIYDFWKNFTLNNVYTSPTVNRGDIIFNNTDVNYMLSNNAYDNLKKLKDRYHL